MVFISKSWSGLALALLSSTVPLSGAAPAAGQTNFLFAFGDSYTTTGFNINGVQPSVSGNPLGNPDVGKGTSTGGANYIGFLATKYKPANYPLLAYDFAVGGATISKSVQPSGSDGTNTVERQIRTVFTPKYSSQRNTLWTSENSIFSIFIGINDIGLSVSNSSKPQANTTIPKLMSAYFGLADELYNAGARRFLFIGVPPTDRSPLIVGQGASYASNYASWVKEYNIQLTDNIKKFVDKYAAKSSAADKVQAVTYDYNRYLTLILNDPAAYGFKDNSCVNATGTTCVWHDSYHVGITVNDLLTARLVPAMSSLGWDGKTPTGGYFY